MTNVHIFIGNAAEPPTGNYDIYRVGQKIGTICLYALTLANIDRFSKRFHCQNQEKTRNKVITKDNI